MRLYAAANMKNAALILLAMLSIVLIREKSGASWLLDAGKFHVSVHGQLSCGDCHESIADGDRHPDPADVNKQLADFFNIDRCLSCHNDIWDNLAKGVHGSETIGKRKTYEACLLCHPPHYQEPTEKIRTERPDSSGAPFERCGECHAHRAELPEFSPDDETCTACHLLSAGQDTKGEKSTSTLCLYCHAPEETKARSPAGKIVSLINAGKRMATPHAEIDCIACHHTAAKFPHRAQKKASCQTCHSRHDEKKTHDAHSGISCQACHVEGVLPVRIIGSKIVHGKSIQGPGLASRAHHLIPLNDSQLCERCHFEGNRIGAVSMVLPAKGILCMPCHAATWSLGDASMIISLVVCLAGLILSAFVWLSGSIPINGPTNGETGVFSKIYALFKGAGKTIFSNKFLLIIQTLVYDVLLQRRLYRLSATRWVIHGLIFFPLVFRSMWGIAGLFGSILFPNQPLFGFLLDKNHPVNAFLFDLTGMMMVLGVVSALVRRGKAQPDSPPGLPKQDGWALILIAGIVGVGFILEGMRIAMTGWPQNAGFAVLGYGLSLLFAKMTGLADIYGYVWYMHALLTGLFAAYLPFSRLIHMVTAPLIMAMNAVAADEKNGNFSKSSGFGAGIR